LDHVKKEDGVTAMVCTYNEEDWVDLSLLSIKDLVREIIVVDSSTDSTPVIINELRYTYGLPIKLFRMRAGDLVMARNLVLKEATSKWILHWDADFIARPELIEGVKKLINELDERRHYLVYWQMIRVCGDLQHVCKDPYHIEHWLFTWSPKLRYQWVDKYDSLIAPIYMYKAVYIPKPLGIHLAFVRRPDRLFIKYIWRRFRREADYYARKGLLDEFVRAKARELYGEDNLQDAGKKLVEEITSTLPRYDEVRFGKLPGVVIMRAKELGVWRDA